MDILLYQDHTVCQLDILLIVKPALDRVNTKHLLITAEPVTDLGNNVLKPYLSHTLFGVKEKPGREHLASARVV